MSNLLMDDEISMKIVKSDKITIDSLIEIKNEIKSIIKQKILYDVANNNNCIKCLFPLNKNYRNIYLNKNQAEKIKKIFPNLLHTIIDDRTRWYILGSFENITNIKLIELLSDEYLDDYKIITIPNYIDSYQQLLKYYELFSDL